jgi:predicted RecB family nuclease
MDEEGAIHEVEQPLAKDGVRDVLEAGIECQYMSYLLMQGETGNKSDYELMLGELRETVKQRAIVKIVSACDKDDVSNEIVLTNTVLRQGRQFILDTNLETDLGMLYIDGVKRVAGFSKLGNFHYIPILFHSGERVGKRQKDFAEAFGRFLAPLQGRSPNRAAIYHSQECCLTTIQLSPALSHGRKLINDLQQIQTATSAPQLILNVHCNSCEFQVRCHKQAVAEDNLSLLRGIGAKELKNFNRKGIFTVKQLAHTFRPRRKGKQVQQRAPHYHALQAMAVRDNTVYLLGKPEIPAKPVQVFIDFEGDLQARHVYLIGVVVREGCREKQYSFWADDKKHEIKIFQHFVSLLRQYEDFTIFAYGGYEKTYIKQMRRAAKCKKDVDRVLERMVNVLSIIYSHVYFPCYSNSLKEIGRFLGCSWTAGHVTGIQAVVWRTSWDSTRNEECKSRLLEYNQEDCFALKSVADFIGAAFANSQGTASGFPSTGNITITPIKESDQTRFDWKWGKVNFCNSDFEQINKCAYFDYQRERVYIRTNKSLRRQIRKREKRINQHLRVSKHIKIMKTKCPSCKGMPVIQISAQERHTDCKIPRRRRAYNLAFSPTGVRRQILSFHTQVHQCTSCGHEFVPEEHLRLDRHFHALKSFAIYLHIAHRVSLTGISQVIEELCGIHLQAADIHMFKSLMAGYYRQTYRNILKRLKSGRLMHADETEVHLQDKSGYVWVFTNMQEVYYEFRPSREGEFLKEMLRPFSGVLVSDFYSVYDTLNCPQQKCLIHLIQDMNQLLLANPFDEELQMVTQPFGTLLRNIIETIDQYGLKARALRHHKAEVAKYFRNLANMSFASDASISLRDRLLKYQSKLFTFLKYDGIPWNNNNAENVIKRFAKYREQTQSSLREGRFGDYLILLSICETCRYRGISFLRFMLSGLKDIDKYSERKSKSYDTTKPQMYPKGFIHPGLAFLRRLGKRHKDNKNSVEAETGFTNRSDGEDFGGGSISVGE